MTPLRDVERLRLRRGLRRRHLFRTARLNAVGWAAVVAASVFSGVVVGVVVRWLGGPVWLGVFLGLPLVLLVLRLLDRRRRAGMTTSFSWTDDDAEVRRAADALAAQGVLVTARPGDVDDPPSLVFAHRDARRVAVGLSSLGLSTPPLH